jgi:hypothetical protein
MLLLLLLLQAFQQAVLAEKHYEALLKAEEEGRQRSWARHLADLERVKVGDASLRVSACSALLSDNPGQ